MIISISRGVGAGPTPLAAFDRALMAAGIHNFNHIPLSSVIPPGASIERHAFRLTDDEYGNRLYVVIAHQETAEPGTEAWAGLGWVQETDDHRGLFVEFSGTSRGQVQADIAATLEDMMVNRGKRYGPIDCELAGTTCRDQPVAALVAAVYRSDGWE
jgi:arginine decarboxylase